MNVPLSWHTQALPCSKAMTCFIFMTIYQALSADRFTHMKFRQSLTITEICKSEMIFFLSAKKLPMRELIRSVSYSQSEIIQNILNLHVPQGKIDCDPTFSTGAFYRGTGISIPEYRFDIHPQSEDVIKADARHLPLSDRSIFCMVLDPPFLATKGKSLDMESGNCINKRFGVYPDEKSLHRCYVDMLREAHRVLKNNGILIFKCQDKVSSGKQYLSHVFIINKAVETGFYPKDLFILLARSRLTADWQKQHQIHARKYHCYFLVFQKNDRKIQYV